MSQFTPPNMDDLAAALADAWEGLEEAVTQESNAFWQSLSFDQQRLAFYAVISRLAKAELEDGLTYRQILDQFHSDQLSGMACGFHALHSALNPVSTPLADTKHGHTKEND